MPQKFQFHEGPIKTTWLTKPSPKNHRFNSMKVRLKQKETVNVQVVLPRFNSMKVRLKRVGELNATLCTQFQFHEGPIKTSSCTLWHRPPPSFNSMKVRLKPSTLDSSASLAAGFNSMKVRLKPMQRAESHSRTLFQFHEGPIKTRPWRRQIGFGEVSIPWRSD